MRSVCWSRHTSVAYLCLVRHMTASQVYRALIAIRGWLDFRRMALRLEAILARQLVQVDSSVCRTDRRRYGSRFLGSHAGRYVVFSAVGAVDLCCSPCPCVAHKPVPSASLLSVVAACFRCNGHCTYAVIDRCDCCDVLSTAAARLFRCQEVLTSGGTQREPLPCSALW